MSIVLVTGSRGFTGRYIIPLLKQQGYKTVGLTHAGAGMDEVRCDLRDASALNQLIADVRPKYVIHLAGLSFVAEQDQSSYYQTNLFGTENLLQALAKLPVLPEKIILASSANVYGAVKEQPIQEAVCPQPANHYAMSKLAMEYMARTWFNHLPIIITRPFNYTGPGQDQRFLVPKIVSHFQHKRPVIKLGNLEVARDFSDVRDLVVAYVDLLVSPIHSEVVNICSGKAIALRQILAYLSNLSGYTIEVVVNAALVRDNEIKILVGSNRKLKQQVGFAPKYTFDQTLLDMYRVSII